MGAGGALSGGALSGAHPLATPELTQRESAGPGPCSWNGLRPRGRITRHCAFFCLTWRLRPRVLWGVSLPQCTTRPLYLGGRLLAPSSWRAAWRGPAPLPGQSTDPPERGPPEVRHRHRRGGRQCHRRRRPRPSEPKRFPGAEPPAADRTGE